MWKRVIVALVLLVALALGILQLLGSGFLGEPWDGGHPIDAPIPDAVTHDRVAAQRAAAARAGVSEPRQILFGDLHVHSTFSTDAFMMALPMSGGDGARPVSDACDFARHCSALDFWSINDHALALTPRRWDETVRAMRECAEVSGDPTSPDVSPFLGWEWTQVGTTPENHYGHKNVVLRHLDDGRIPARPISAGLPRGADRDTATVPAMAFGLLVATAPSSGVDLTNYFREMLSADACPSGVPVRDLPDDCIEAAHTPAELFSKLDDWGHDDDGDPARHHLGLLHVARFLVGQAADDRDHARPAPGGRLVEVFSGHGNSRGVRAPSARSILERRRRPKTCPAPKPRATCRACWQRRRDRPRRAASRPASRARKPPTCSARAETARQHFVDAGFNGGGATVPGQRGLGDWQDAGQCRDCFQPSFNYRPRSFGPVHDGTRPATASNGDPLRFRFGFIAAERQPLGAAGHRLQGVLPDASSPSMRFGNVRRTRPARRRRRPEGRCHGGALAAEDQRRRSAGASSSCFETERQASFFLTGGLVAAHSAGRSRDAVWDAMHRKEVYGTSGTRILLWFDLLNAPGTRGAELPMGSEVSFDARSGSPIFRVRAVGSFRQQPGCPAYASDALGPEALDRLCKGECYHPSDTRKLITRIEVVRIRPQQHPGEPVTPLIEDPWRVIACEPDPEGCRVTFSDPEFAAAGRDTVYYVRAIEEPSEAVNADGIGCREVPIEDDCLGEVEERAWSSPIFVDHSAARAAARTAAR